ncbi:hypothetical protein BASA60_007407 [Batrachochytrium salamandrivorans]|nr:hypothetical protein BASA60_007407 [Batrachochytrium salamandrivorans]
MIITTILAIALAITSVTAKAAVCPTHGSLLASSGATTSNIIYTMGAPIITKPVTVYYIYYGSWSSSQKTIVEDFTRGIGSSKWWDIEKRYYYQASSLAQRVYVNGTVLLGATVTDNYTLGRALSGSDLPNLIQRYISTGALPQNTDAVYFVLTATDVTEKIRPDIAVGSFCVNYCGYHLSTVLLSGARVFYAMAGNLPASCYGSCAPPKNQLKSPNGDIGVDAMLSVIAHELAEAVSDPQSDRFRAWQDRNGYENADKCSYRYGTTSLTPSGASYNMGWGNHSYLIQQNWDPVTQSCALQVASSTATASASDSTGTSTATTRVIQNIGNSGNQMGTAIASNARTTYLSIPIHRPTERSYHYAPLGQSCNPSNICCRFFGFDC